MLKNFLIGNHDTKIDYRSRIRIEKQKNPQKCGSIGRSQPSRPIILYVTPEAYVIKGWKQSQS